MTRSEFIRLATGGILGLGFDSARVFGQSPTSASGPGNGGQAAPVFGSVTLPEAVPYFGNEEKYFLGSGVSGAGGTTGGTWDFLIGPDYTSPNFLTSESLSVIIDGVEKELVLKMHRGRKSGIFWGTQQIGNITVCLVDFTNQESSWVGRSIRLSNRGSASHRIRIKADIEPSGTSVHLVDQTAVKIVQDTTAWNFGTHQESKNWANRYAQMTFNVKSTASQTGSKFEIVTDETTVAPGRVYWCGLYHWQHYDETGKSDRDYVSAIRERNVLDDLATSISQWSQWIDSGDMSGSRITDPKARDVVEACLIAVKMQQHRDGGTIAGTRAYAHSYVRDTHGGMRLMGLTGHLDEVKKAILEIDRKRKAFQHIPNAWQMGSDSWHHDSSNRNQSEITAYFVLMLRDYCHRTRDSSLADCVYDTLKDAIDTQLDWMSQHRWVIDFNGDETEKYTCRVDGTMYGNLTGWDNKNLSFSACAAAAVSTRYFIDYLSKKGDLGQAGAYQDKLTHVLDAIDATFWNDDLQIHDWTRQPGGGWPAYRVTDFDNLPLWLGAELNRNRQAADALAMKAYLNPATGFLPVAPGDSDGFCGHTLALMLYNLKKLNDAKADDVYQTIMNSKLLSCWGTVSEFYGPGGVPNGHNFRVFESGPTGEAIVRYFIGF